MINMPYADIIGKIKEQKSVSEEELEGKIKQKMDQLSGLISKEGAAYIVANDYGVKLVQTEGPVKVKDIVNGIKNVETAGKVTRKFNVIEFDKEDRKGKVGSFMLADETGEIRVTAWNDQTQLLENFNEGDVVKIVDGYVRGNQGQNEVHLNSRSKLTVNPLGVKIEGVKAVASGSGRKKISELQENDQGVEVLATVVQVFDPRFFEQCPECRKRLVQGDEGFMCEEHGSVEPKYSYVANIVLDDGSDNIRAVMFREAMQDLFKKTDSELQKMRDSQEVIEAAKTELLGEQVIITGRVVRNKMFDRLEIVANKVNRDVNPEEEIAKLKSE